MIFEHGLASYISKKYLIVIFSFNGTKLNILQWKNYNILQGGEYRSFTNKIYTLLISTKKKMITIRNYILNYSCSVFTIM